MVSVREKNTVESGRWGVPTLGRVQFSVGRSGCCSLRRAVDETWREWVSHVDLWGGESQAEETASANGPRWECSWQERAVAGVWPVWLDCGDEGRWSGQGEWDLPDLEHHCKNFCFCSERAFLQGNLSWRVTWSDISARDRHDCCVGNRPSRVRRQGW